MNLTTILLNFKEYLLKNYYTREDEENEFLNWLHDTITYDNGELQIHEEYINNEEEITPSTHNYTKLKELVSSWSRSKYKKQDYWNKTIDNLIGQYNGGIYLNSNTYSFVKVNYIIHASYSSSTSTSFYITIGTYDTLLDEHTFYINGEKITPQGDSMLIVLFKNLGYRPETVELTITDRQKRDKVYLGGKFTINLLNK